MKKIASFVSLSVAALGLAAGCAVEAVDSAELDAVGAGEEAACSNPDGTNAMIASLAAAIGAELGRFELLSDFEIYRGTYNQEMLRIKSSVRYASPARCRNNCAGIDALLAFQEPSLDQQWKFKDGTKLNSWTYASRLATGYRNQQTCEGRPSTDANTCKGAETHYLERVGITNALCDNVDYGMNMVQLRATKGNTNGSEFSPETALVTPNRLNRKLVWANNNSSSPNDSSKLNPFLQFSVVDGFTVEVDPGDGTQGEEPAPPAACEAMCQATSNPAIAGACCICAGVSGTMKPWTGYRIPPNSFKCLP
jgi:hypothetical protein